MDYSEENQEIGFDKATKVKIILSLLVVGMLTMTAYWVQAPTELQANTAGETATEEGTGFGEGVEGEEGGETEDEGEASSEEASTPPTEAPAAPPTEAPAAPASEAPAAPSSAAADVAAPTPPASEPFSFEPTNPGATSAADSASATGSASEEVTTLFRDNKPAATMENSETKEVKDAAAALHASAAKGSLNREIPETGPENILYFLILLGAGTFALKQQNA